MARAKVIDRPVLNNWDRLTDHLSAALSRERIEQFRVLFLDRKNLLIRGEQQQRGTVDHTPLYPREVVKRCLELAASAAWSWRRARSSSSTTTRAATRRPPRPTWR